jgi:hypothetical protein
MSEAHVSPDGDATERDGETLRLAVISSPRSGNTWVRQLLARIYGLEEIPVHFPEEIDWDHLPRRCVIQVHAYPVESFPGLLEQHGVRVVVLARHPLDVLASWLNLVFYSHQEGYCPGGGACDECALVGVLPRSREFMDWACSDHGRLFLCYSPAWWRRPGVIRGVYEEFVADPEAALGRMVEQIGEPPRSPIAEVVASGRIGQKKSSQEVWHFHYWQGRPGLWRCLFPAAEARAIAANIPEAFEWLGYDCDPDATLDGRDADQNWLRLQLDSTREHLRLERMKHRQTLQNLTALRARAGALETELLSAAQPAPPEPIAPPPAPVAAKLPANWRLSLGERIPTGLRILGRRRRRIGKQA